SVPDIFAQALDVAPAERESFLQKACAGNQDLYREVQSLLGELADSKDFLEHSALSLATRAMSREVTPLESGSKLGRYVILKELGQGGMGDVFHARDDIGLDVAIKVLPDYFAQDAERVSRFESEARKMAQLNHPNIASIHGRELIGGWRFLVLEYVAGETLEARLERGPLPVRDALPIFSQIADALAATHRKDIVHRDLKPSNIMIMPNGHVKLLDFGIAKHFRYDEALDHAVGRDLTMSTLTQSLTAHGFTPGTLPYMSPEQRVGGKTDQATDLWAFGVVLYEALTGQHPFRRDTREETSLAIVNFTPNWNLLPGETPSSVRELLKRCLAKDSKDRLRDAAEAKQILTTTQQDLERGFELSHWWRQFKARFGRPVLVGVVSMASVLAGIFGWSWYQQKTLQIAVIAPTAAQCPTLNVTELVTRIEPLSRIQTSLHTAQTTTSHWKLLFSTQCEGTTGKTLVRLVNQQELTVFAQFAESSEQVFRKLRPLLEAAARLIENPSALNLQLNLVAPTLTNLTPEQQRLLNLDNWDNESLLNAAIDEVRKLITQQGDSARLQAALSRAHLYKFKFTQHPDDKKAAYDAYLKALTLAPDAPEALIAAGEFNTSLDPTDAIKYFQRAIQQRPNDPQATRGLARAYELAGKYDQAEEQYLLSVALRPEYWGGFSEIGNYYSERGEHLLAAEYLTTAAKLGKNAAAYINLGAAYFYQGRLTEALAAYEKALEWPAHPDAHIGCGMIHYLNGNYQEAANSFRAAKDLDANFADAWGFLGQALHFINGRHTESRAALQQAIQLARNQLRQRLDPLDAETTKSLLALWLAINQEIPEAINTINAVLATAEHQKDATMLLRAAIIHHLARQDKKALEYITQYLAHGGTIQDLEREPFLNDLRPTKNYQNALSQTQALSPATGGK
ncbi:MAG TPA: protein kinase, partial [Blastocatellia bacterium]|nr:protein kinase [Blastocatellia bacterium]